MGEFISSSCADAQVTFDIRYSKIILFKRNFLFHIGSPYIFCKLPRISLPSMGGYDMIKGQKGLFEKAVHFAFAVSRLPPGYGFLF